MPTYIIKQRGDTAAAWDIANPVLAEREVGWILDSAHLACKIGDGVTPWKSLPVRTGPQGPAGDSNMLLSDSVSSTASAVAASSKAVKMAYDLAAKTRIRATANITVYARLTGNDNNDGLTPETAKRWGNTARALLKNYDLSGYIFNIDLGEGFFDEDLVIHSYGTSAHDIVVNGAGIGKTRVRLIQSRTQIVYVQNLSAQLNVNFGGTMYPRNVEAIPSSVGQDCCDAYAGIIQLTGPMTISSPADRRGYHGVKAAYGGSFISNNHPITYTDGAEFTSSGFSPQGAASHIDLGTTVFSGSFIGRTVYGRNDGKISISGSDFGVIPGSLPAYLNDRMATTSLIGPVQLATTSEAVAGTNSTKAVTPEGVSAAISASGGGLTPPLDTDSKWKEQATYTTNQSITVPDTVAWVKAVLKAGAGNAGGDGAAYGTNSGNTGGAGGKGEIATSIFSTVLTRTVLLAFGAQGNGNAGGAGGNGYNNTFGGAGGAGGKGVQIINVATAYGGGGGGGGGAGTMNESSGGAGGAGGASSSITPLLSGYTAQQAGSGASGSTGGKGGAGLTFTSGNTSATPSCTVYYINK